MNDLNIPLLPEKLDIWQQTLNWQPHPEHIVLWQKLYEQVLIGNRQLNLTRITSPDEFWEKHLWDSLRGIGFILNPSESNFGDISDNPKIIDIGTGAGFPGLPIAIARPNASATLIDSTQKKIAFINAIVTKLNLGNIQTITSRAEALGQDHHHRQVYDFATIRAVSSVTVCAEYCLPFLKKDGIGCIYRGQWSQQERVSLESATQELGAEIAAIEEFTTPLTDNQRTCIYLRKIATTPAKYPRQVGIPTQRPL